MSTAPHGAYEPGVIDPGVPVSNPTESFWFSEPSKIAHLQSPWVSEADVVVVGSGMTSVSLCRSILAQNKNNLSIVVVEARHLCSGATGRNGGHCKAMSPGIWFDRKSEFGLSEALKIMEYEHSHQAAMMGACEEAGVQCDFRSLEGLDVYHDTTVFSRACRALEDMRRHAPHLAERYTVYTDRKQLDERKCSPAAVGAIGVPAATAWPYKMVTGIFEHLLSKHPNNLSFQTHTTVTSIHNPDNDPKIATVRTSRGEIRARHVVHATNAWMGHLLPELRPYVSPVRANVQRHLVSSSSSSGGGGGGSSGPTKIPDTSLWLRYGEHEYDYLMQRPDGAFIVGRATTGRRATADDGNTDLAPQMHLRGATPLVFKFGEDDKTTATMKGSKREVTHAWSGCVAFTQDGNPFVGRLDMFENRSSQWVCAAYQGIGMVRAFRAAEVLGAMIVASDSCDDGSEEGMLKSMDEKWPRSMIVTKERVKRLRSVVEGVAGRESKL